MDVEAIEEKLDKKLNELETAISLEDDQTAQELVDDINEAREDGDHMKCVGLLKELESYLENQE